MSGCGRKHRAKHLVGQYLDDEAWKGPDLNKGDTLAVCIGPPSGKHLHVLRVAPAYVTYPSRLKQLISSLNGITDKKGDDMKYAAKEISSSVNNKDLEKNEENVLTGVSTPNELRNIFDKQRELGKETMMSISDEKGVVSLPGKFHKVLWLAGKDVIIERDGTVQYKPNNAQLKSYFDQWETDVANACSQLSHIYHNVSGNNTGVYSNSPEETDIIMPNLRECIAQLQTKAANLGASNHLATVAAATAMKQQKLNPYAIHKKTHKKVLGGCFGGTSNHHAPVITPTAPQEGSTQESNSEVMGDTAMSGVEEDEDDLCNMVNPNRDNIKHRKTNFGILEDDI